MLEVLPSRKVTRFLPRAEEVVVELDGSMARKRATRDMWVGRVQMWSINTLIFALSNFDLKIVFLIFLAIWVKLSFSRIER